MMEKQLSAPNYYTGNNNITLAKVLLTRVAILLFSFEKSFLSEVHYSHNVLWYENWQIYKVTSGM